MLCAQGNLVNPHNNPKKLPVELSSCYIPGKQGHTEARKLRTHRGWVGAHSACFQKRGPRQCFSSSTVPVSPWGWRGGGPRQHAAPHSADPGWGLRLCITNKLPAIPGPRTIPAVRGSKLRHHVPMTPLQLQKWVYATLLWPLEAAMNSSFNRNRPSQSVRRKGTNSVRVSWVGPRRG